MRTNRKGKKIIEGEGKERKKSIVGGKGKGKKT